jgi:hypothetical protein
MWWQENALDRRKCAATVQRPRAEHPADTAAHADTRPRADHAHCAFGLPFYATRAVRAPAGLKPVTPSERRDMPWILLLAAVVVLIVIIGVWN